MKQIKKLKFLILFTTCLTFLCWKVSLVAAQTDQASPKIVTTFYSESGVSLEELSAGEIGQGLILYYLSGRELERPSLVVRLYRRTGSASSVAEVYQAPPGKNYVPIAVQKNQVQLDSILRPSILIYTNDGWWQKKGRPNYNLDVEIFGPMYAMWGAGYTPSDGFTQWAARVTSNQPTVRIEVRDPQQEGVPKWDWRTLLPSFPGQGYYRTNYAERKCLTPLQFESSISPLWPYVAQKGDFQQPSGKLAPPIVVDWNAGRIIDFSELVTVRNQNCSYSFYSLDPLSPNKLNVPDFETPFAFYDLSGQSNGYPNLILRTQRHPTNDPWSNGIDPKVMNGKLVPREIEWLRYSWSNEIGTGQMDYKVEVLGFHPYNNKTPIAGGQFNIDAPSYEQFPNWVVSQNWPAVTFVDTEGKRYLSNEGIYEWSPLDLGIAYLLGWSEKPIDTAFQSQAQGLRGEYRFTKDTQPFLYFSPIDNRLHLKGAEGGLWPLDRGTVLRVSALNGSRYINAWTLEEVQNSTVKDVPDFVNAENSQVKQSLYALGNSYLIYGSDQKVSLLSTKYASSLFETLPPSDKQSWQNLREQLAQFKKRDPRNLESWLKAFPGDPLTITAAKLSEVSQNDNGFRFVLELLPGYSVNGSNLLGIANLAPGKYLVNYDGIFNVKPLTSPQLVTQVTFQPSLLGKVPQLGLPVGVSVQLTNNGLQDVQAVSVEVTATLSGHKSVPVGKTKVNVLADQPTKFENTWVPNAEGEWNIEVKLQVGEFSSSTSQYSLKVAPSQEPGMEDVATAFGITPVWFLPIFVCLTSFMLITTTILLFRKRGLRN